ncbi:MAG: MYXO-CTERM sorting domain-containing protein [Planctomycetota bacterium]|nr:MYXO-CTERM sorting domain-containing protein [Planctomycetota bacterium]
MAISAILGGAALLSTAIGSTYTDPVGDIATGNANLDIVSVEVVDDGWDVEISLTVSDLDGDWGKYMVFFDYTAGGSGDNDNPWIRDVAGLEGMDLFLGSWADGGGGAAMNAHNGSGWGDSDIGVTTQINWEGDTITWRLAGFMNELANSGAAGFSFEIATTGGNQGDPAIDLLGGEDTQPGWGQGSTSTDQAFYAIPAPGALALLGLAGLAGRRRRRH